MARGELMKKLLASYGREEEFRAVAEEIIGEEEKKNNRVLARSLRRSLDAGPARSSRPKALAPLIPFPEAAGDFVELVEPKHDKQDIILSPENIRIFLGLLRESRAADSIRRRGLAVRSKLLFCGPPGCGKTLCAEIFAGELPDRFFQPFRALQRNIHLLLGDQIPRPKLVERGRSPCTGRLNLHRFN